MYNKSICLLLLLLHLKLNYTLLKNLLKNDDMHAIFEISETRPKFDTNTGSDLDIQSDDEFVFVW